MFMKRFVRGKAELMVPFGEQDEHEHCAEILVVPNGVDAHIWKGDVGICWGGITIRSGCASQWPHKGRARTK